MFAGVEIHERHSLHVAMQCRSLKCVRVQVLKKECKNVVPTKTPAVMRCAFISRRFNQRESTSSKIKNKCSKAPHDAGY